METERKRRVLLVDDSPAFRGLMQWYLGTLPEVEVVAEATDGEQAIAAVERLQPDVVLMDVRMPNMDGLEATRRIRAGAEPLPRILLLTNHATAIPAGLAAEAGADDLLDKAELADRLPAAIANTMNGTRALRPPD
ncbi:MAG TPA: response regulator transcription factor [Polyangia bacterium]|jgi:CheY-like chemotaxis protein